VDVDVFLTKIMNLDLNESEYDVRGTLNFIWCDPRKAFNPGLGTYTLTNDNAADIVVFYAQMWFPEIRFRNDSEPRTSDNVRI